MVSNAFETSRNTAIVCSALFLAMAISFASLWMVLIVDLFFRNPPWCLYRLSLVSRNSTTLSFIYFSNNLPIIGVRVIGLMLFRFVTSPFFGIGVTQPIFQLSGKMPVLMDVTCRGHK